MKVREGDAERKKLGKSRPNKKNITTLRAGPLSLSLPLPLPLFDFLCPPY